MEQRKITIIRDYTDTPRDEPEFTESELARMMKSLRRKHVQQDRVYMVDPIASARFDKAVNACNAMAMEFAGKMCATVNFESYEADITLECAYIEFCHQEFMETLSALSLISKEIRISSMISERFQIEVLMPYFVPLKSK